MYIPYPCNNTQDVVLSPLQQAAPVQKEANSQESTRDGNFNKAALKYEKICICKSKPLTSDRLLGCANMEEPVYHFPLWQGGEGTCSSAEDENGILITTVTMQNWYTQQTDAPYDIIKHPS